MKRVVFVYHQTLFQHVAPYGLAGFVAHLCSQEYPKPKLQMAVS